MKPRRRWIREPFSGLSHLVGALLSVVALVVLLVMTKGRPTHIVGFAIYGASLIILYSISTLYHSLPLNDIHLRWMQRCDHMAIFLLIAGTYTPVCLICLHGVWRWGLLCGVYGLALLGIGFLLFWKNAPHWVRVVLYIGMGWLAVSALSPLHAALSSAGLAWLIAGGVIYSVGTVVYATERPNLWPGKFGAHDLWHLFVLGGSACHFIVMCCFVAQLA